MNAPYRLPDEFETDRYHLRQVKLDDAQAIFDSYASDAEVSRFLGWTPHRSVTETTAFLEIAAAEWISGKGFLWSRLIADNLRNLWGCFIHI